MQAVSCCWSSATPAGAASGRGACRRPAASWAFPAALTCLLSFWMSRLRLITCSRFSSYARSWASMRSKSLRGG